MPTGMSPNKDAALNLVLPFPALRSTGTATSITGKSPAIPGMKSFRMARLAKMPKPTSKPGLCSSRAPSVFGQSGTGGPPDATSAPSLYSTFGYSLPSTRSAATRMSVGMLRPIVGPSWK